MRTLAAALLMLCCAAAAQAETGAAAIRVAIPEGYCTFNGPDAIERAMASALRSGVAKEDGVLLQALTPCAQREAVRNMVARFYEDYVVLAAYPKAAPPRKRRSALTGAEFIRMLASDADKRGWKAATDRIMRWDRPTTVDGNGRIGADIVKPPRLLAKEDKAVYLEAVAYIYTADREFDSPIVVGVTVVRGLPVAITGYSRNAEAGPRLYEAVRAATEALIAANP
jgi:hypothetical protein